MHSPHLRSTRPVLLLDIRWGGRPEVVLSLAGTPVRMTHIQLSGRLRIQLSGLLDEVRMAKKYAGSGCHAGDAMPAGGKWACSVCE